MLRRKGKKGDRDSPSAIADKEYWIAHQPKLMSLEFNLVASSDFGSQVLRVWRGSVTLDLIQRKVGIPSISSESKHFSRGEKWQLNVIWSSIRARGNLATVRWQRFVFSSRSRDTGNVGNFLELALCHFNTGTISWFRTWHDWQLILSVMSRKWI